MEIADDSTFNIQPGKPVLHLFKLGLGLGLGQNKSFRIHNQCFGSGFTEFRSEFKHFAEPGSGSRPGCCWIRIRTKVFYNVEKKFRSKTPVICVFLNPYKGHPVYRRSLQRNKELLQHEFAPFLSFFGDNFGLARSGFADNPDPLTIRIRVWILIWNKTLWPKHYKISCLLYLWENWCTEWHPGPWRLPAAGTWYEASSHSPRSCTSGSRPGPLNRIE